MTLQGMGYTNVKHIRKGIFGWFEAKLPLNEGT